jgi:hypothetical protein
MTSSSWQLPLNVTSDINTEQLHLRNQFIAVFFNLRKTGHFEAEIITSPSTLEESNECIRQYVRRAKINPMLITV